MKSRKNIFYFPVDGNEQALLLRVRESAFAGRVGELVEMVELLAEARLSPADLDQAIQLLVQSQQGEGLDARFDNLEARLKDRIEKGLAEIEGRLSKRLAEDNHTKEERPKPPQPKPRPVKKPPLDSTSIDDPQDVPKDASLAVRVGSDLLWGTSAKQFYVSVWRWLFHNGLVDATELPIRSGKRRYTLATSPVHPSGKPFFAQQEIAPGVWLETHGSRENILRNAEKHLSQRAVKFEIVVGTDA